MRGKDLVKLIPTQVRITKDVAYEVVWVDEFVNDRKQLGECRFDTKQIVISKKQSDREAFLTYIHELGHSISFENPGLELTEKQVQILEKAVFRVLRLNNLLKK